MPSPYSDGPLSRRARLPYDASQAAISSPTTARAACLGVLRVLRVVAAGGGADLHLDGAGLGDLRRKPLRLQRPGGQLRDLRHLVVRRALRAVGAELVFCAAAIRFPWKKHQTGFVVTHAGIILMLLGSWLSQRGGVDANLPVFEGQSNWRAFEESQHFKLTVTPAAAASGSGQSAEPRVIRVPFFAGPFNWDDYRHLFFFPWSLALRDRGTVYDRDGIKLEVLDYYSDSVQLPLPRLTLRAESESRADDPMQGGTPVELKVPGAAEEGIQLRPFGGGDRQKLPRGQEVVFWMTGDPGEAEAFRNSQPRGPAGQPRADRALVPGAEVRFRRR